MWQVFWEFGVQPQWSFFVAFPVLILAVPGWWKYSCCHTAEAVFLLTILLVMFAIVEPLPFWRGEPADGPRYFLYLLPVLSLPALYVLEWPSNPLFKKLRPTLSRNGRPRLELRTTTVQEHVAGCGRRWLSRTLISGVFIAASFFAVAQFQVQRLGFFAWNLALRHAAGDNSEVKRYFNATPIPKICWDHLRCRDNLEELPYYPYLRAIERPRKLRLGSGELLSHVNFSNLYWFPNINK